MNRITLRHPFTILRPGRLLGRAAALAGAIAAIAMNGPPAARGDETAFAGIGFGGPTAIGTPLVVSGTDQWLTGGVNVSSLVGGYRFYNAGITGQNTSAWVVDAGLAWGGSGGHESLSNLSLTVGGTDAANTPDWHATACAMLLGGRPATPYTDANGNPYYSVVNTGIAWGATLGSAALATKFNADGSFDISNGSLVAAFSTAAGMADVISTSIGETPDPSAVGTMGGLVDALARSHGTTTIVAAAGNEGQEATASGRMLGSPASGYNSIAVGALGTSGNPSTYTSVAPFSSRGPLPTEWYDGTTVYAAAGGAATRAGVDIVAPGTALVSAAYISGTGPNGLYYLGLDGTSFATPLVAGGASLLVSTAKSASLFADIVDAATQSVVVKSVLLNSADKLSGWSNGQTTSGGVITTTQALDWSMGAGSLDLSRAFDQYVAGTRDVGGTASQLAASVWATGWDYGSINLHDTNRYAIIGTQAAGETLTVTLDWLRDRIWDATLNSGSGDYRDVAQANLDLSVWDVTTGAGTLVAQSTSLVNTVEHLSFALPGSGLYELRVGYGDNLFDLSGAYATQDYGLSWSLASGNAIIVPEPSAWAMLAAGIAASVHACRRRRA